MTDFQHLVRRHAREQGAPDLPAHAVRELAEHLEDLYRDAVAGGASEVEARERALAVLAESSLAGLEGSRVRNRPPAVPAPVPGLVPASPLRSLSMGHAIRQALRQFVLQRTFSLVTVLVLGLGIGASVTVYTVVDGVLLKPLPYAAPDRLVTLWDTNYERGLSHEPLSPVNFMDYRTLDVFTDAAAWWRPDVNLADPGMDPVRVKTIETGANLFSVLGVSPQIGPGFPADEPYFSGNLIAVISDRLWRARYSADPGIIGRQLQQSGNAYTIVGVMPPKFDFPGEIDVWQRSRWDFTQHSRSAHFMEAVARLAPGTDVARADAAVTAMAAKLQTDFANTNKAWAVRLVPLLDEQLGYYRPALMVLFGAVGVLMLIGVLNVGSLLLTRALSREREVAVRTALGASPRHLVTQLLAEASLLSIAGAAAGVLASLAALPLLIAATPVEIPRLDEAVVNFRALGFALALSVGATLFFGLIPAIVLIRRSLTADLKVGDRGSSRASRLLYRGLVVSEVALAAALLVGSGLLIRTVAQMTDVPVGVGRPSVVTSSVQLSGAAYGDWAVVGSTFGTFLDRLREQPGVRAAGMANFLPLEAGWRVPFAIEGEPIPAQLADLPQAQYHSASEGYFESIGAPLVSGRYLTSRDTPDAPGAVVVNETFAKRYLANPRPQPALLTSASGIGPLGRVLTPRTPLPGFPNPVSRYEIVGVVADVRDVPLGQPVEPAIYFSARQFPFRAMFVTVDAADVPTAVGALRKTLRDVTPGIPHTDALTWADRFRSRTAEPRLLMTVLVFFGGLAGLLASLGVYGLFSWMVALRRRELAIRLTLGARPVGVGGIVVRQAALLVGVGLVAGWVVMQFAGNLLSRVLFNVTTNDASALVFAMGLLAVASIAACLPPAWRAMRVDPLEGLKD